MFRNIPSDTPRHGDNWNTSPEEDFAEVYKNVFTGIDVKTNYGLSNQNAYERSRCEFEKTIRQYKQELYRAISRQVDFPVLETEECDSSEEDEAKEKIKDFINALMEK